MCILVIFLYKLMQYINNVFGSYLIEFLLQSIFIYIVCKRDFLISPLFYNKHQSGKRNYERRPAYIPGRMFPSCDNARFHESDINQPDAAGRHIIALPLTMSYNVITRSFTMLEFLPGSPLDKKKKRERERKILLPVIYS